MKLDEIQRRKSLHQDTVNNIILHKSAKNTQIVSFKSLLTDDGYEPEDCQEKKQKLLVWYSGPTTRVVRRTFADAGFISAPKESSDWHVCWGSPKGVQFYSTLAPGQYCNQIPGSNSMGRKDTLATYIHASKIRFPDQYDIIPKTFVLPQQAEEMHEFFIQNPKQFFIYKPAMGARGNGIELTTGERSVSDKETAAVVQEYLRNPLILKGYKFDFRVYACVTSIDPLIVYVYENGIGRFATSKYQDATEENLNQTTMHLTNFSVNSKSDKFVNKPITNQEDSDIIDLDMNFPSKWMLPDLLDFIQNNKDLLPKKFENADVKTIILNQIYEIVQKTFISCESRLYSFAHQAGTANSYPRRNFGMYGFDMILDDDLHMLLIEVNSSPATGTSTELDVLLKFPLLSDLLHLIGMEIGQDQNGKIIVPTLFYNEGKKQKYYESETKTVQSEFQLKESERKLSFDSIQDIQNIDWSNLTDLERNCLLQIADEHTRTGEWTMVLPSAADDYLQLFENQRYLNVLCQKFLKDDIETIQIWKP
ncbi:Tubulin tyrosine ligase [Spironucleus salmonicida]|uniref:Tubulin--tyrosine ligase-like protein 5 n=1 Tax=Spironucleus salmonicida TaxID=348837 RepID=V6LL13_9EUKA|nr:Tubulin tyrosine ligase [Spironucleus salmonicida]|eukprot:EST45320.1 Tubulin tyrosine ligase [Spironucleus salmonicida]